jgi:glutathione peroxidase
MYKILIAAFIYFLSPANIYELSITSSSGATVSLGTLQGKKMLFVNIATGSPLASQLAGLQELQDRYGDSLAVIAIPSNSFGNEARSNADIKVFCEASYHITFLIAQKDAVTDTDLQPLYQWLTSAGQNGVLTGTVKADYQKYLVDGEGNLVAVFAGRINPTDPKVISAITGRE